MNLNLRAEKQNYYLASLNYVVTIVISVYCIKHKNYFFEKNSYFLRLLFAFTKIFVFNDGQKLTEVRNNFLEEMNPQWDCIVSKNTCFQQIFRGTEKKSKKILQW